MAVWGNLLALAVTVGLLAATLRLGRGRREQNARPSAR
jgi:hypothetical protein